MLLQSLLLLGVLFCGSGQAVDVKPVSGCKSYRYPLFERGKTPMPFEQDDGDVVPRVPHSFRVPSLVEVDGVLVAIGDARYLTSDDNSFIETVAMFSVDDGDSWKSQTVIKNSRVNSNYSRVLDPTIIVKGNNIYVLVGSYNITSIYWNWQEDGSDWEPLLVVGEVGRTDPCDIRSANILWSKPVSLKSIYPNEVGGYPSVQFLGGVSTAIALQNGTLVFPIQRLTIANNNKIVWVSVMYSEDNGKTWTFAEGNAEQGCSEPSILEWEGKLIMNARRDDGYRRVYESTDMGETWLEARGTLSRVWGNSPKRVGPGSQSSFIPVTIEGVRVMLFTHPLNFKGRWDRDRLHLWVTDNRRIFDVGQISVGDENSAYSSLLYTKGGKLYCLHETNKGEVYSLVFAHLINELELIKSVVRTWKAQDNYFSYLCTNNCPVPFPAAGLVGFLSDHADVGNWRDVYRCVDATVVNGEKVPNGFIFKGPDGGARWPVSKQGQNQRYQFSNDRFTLLATVIIHHVPTGAEPIPILGLENGGEQSVRFLELAYTSEKKWRPTFGAKEARPTSAWELNKPFQVVLAMAGKRLYAYVNGKMLEGSGVEHGYDLWKVDISHIYIGGRATKNTDAGNQVTVTNVLLFNRKLSDDELRSFMVTANQITVAPGLEVEEKLECVVQETTIEPSAITPSSVLSGTKEFDEVNANTAATGENSPGMRCDGSLSPTCVTMCHLPLLLLLLLGLGSCVAAL
ncbi:sialidase [Trypanosoma grayi]|uniref:sialidase n=1 Tax=Trypanosoma grayi TaxID=71804 RepID=UPI0004F4B561|nr:sialidase [Trypanosoma grayi]KEG06015.1 sialidase [Trypanosoma grayi]